MPGAGTASSADFGMPDPAKCKAAAACTSGQYFDGTSCGSTQNPTPYPGTGGSGGVSGSCSAELSALLGSGCHSMGNAWFDSTMINYVMPNTTQVKSCASAPISGCSGSGQPVSGDGCPAGQYRNGAGTCVTAPPSCTSGQYWNGSACVTSSTSGGTIGSECRSQSSQSSCSATSGCYWYTGYSGNYCDSSGSAAPSGGTGGSYTSCPSGQYWNGSACVTTSTTDCTSGQYWNGSACVNSSTSPTPTPTSSSCGSGQYWDSRTSSCQSMQAACAEAGGTWDSAANYCRMPSSSAAQKPLAFLCPGGHDWNGSYCVLKPASGVEMYLANVLSAFRSLLDF